jgi:alpha-tubulin suppressor-like RCC1 family protein
VISIAAGNGHSLALKSDGTVWVWGYNAFGQLGDGTTEKKTRPVRYGTD